MDYNFSLPFLQFSSVFLLPLLIFLIISLKPNTTSPKKLPPGPPGWPVFGHLFSLGPLPYRTMAKLKHKYGPVVWLKIGSINTMVILSASAAAELYKNHDLSFSDRALAHAATSHDYHKSSMLFTPYGPFWRMLRRLCNAGMNARINDSLEIRRKCVDDMVSWIRKEAESGMIEKRGIKIIDFLLLANVNVIGNILFSKDLVEPNSLKSTEFIRGVTSIFGLIGEPNFSDWFSWIKVFDFQGLKRKMDHDLGEMMEVVFVFVMERIEENQKGGGKYRKDLLDVLLEFQGKGTEEPEKLSVQNISVFCLELLFAGVETTSNTVEWALAELLRSKDQLVSAKKEIANAVGRNRRFEEGDIENVPYLQAIVKETLRLHSPAPILVKKANKDTSFMGYDIPKETQVMVNVWEISRDPECWDDPLSFKPERFLGSKIDYKGKDFELIPFGAGRRICVGLPFAHRMVHLILGSLLHEFDWEFEDPYMASDMREKMGLLVKKLEPLKVIPSRNLGLSADRVTQHPLIV